jgi:hypothetical protein
MPYTPDELEMLDSWKNRAMGYRWLHYESMQHFKVINMRFVHASILLSTVASASGFSFTGSDKFGKGIGYVVGALNVIIGLLNSYQRFTKAAEQTELHGSVAMQYGMLYRLLDTELRLSEEHQRTDLIPFARQEMDRLFAHSSSLPDKIISKYMAEFPNAKSKPELCDEISIVETPLANENLATILRSSFAFPTLSNRGKKGSKSASTPSETSTPKSIRDEIPTNSQNTLKIIPPTRLTEVMTEVKVLGNGDAGGFKDNVSNIFVNTQNEPASPVPAPATLPVPVPVPDATTTDALTSASDTTNPALVSEVAENAGATDVSGSNPTLQPLEPEPAANTEQDDSTAPADAAPL